MRRLFLAALLALSVSSCTTSAPSSSSSDGKNGSDCVEFDHKTVHNGTKVVCRMLWCEKGILDQMLGGPATLWCDEVE